MVKEGDICILDESVEYSILSEKPFEVLVLWNGVNGQPLVTRTNEYRPFWTTYSQLVEVAGHIDLAEALSSPAMGMFADAIDYLERANGNCDSDCSYCKYNNDCWSYKCRQMAICSLEAWYKVRTEMQDIMIVSQDEERIYQQIKAIIDKHMNESEVKNEN